MNLILIGYRGCGKSSVGQALADCTGRRFVDLDDAVRARFGNRTVAEIWEDEGEQAFRDMEVTITREVCENDGQIVALGGGTVMQQQARSALEQCYAHTIYLRADAEVLHQRIHADQSSADQRPPLSKSGGDLSEIRSVLAEREPVYREVADEIVEVGSLAIEDIVQRLVGVCGNHGS